MRTPLLTVAAGLAALAGCRSERNELDVPLVEEWRAPPREERFDHPPELGYRKPPPKTEFKPGLGGPGGGGGGGLTAAGS